MGSKNTILTQPFQARSRVYIVPISSCAPDASLFEHFLPWIQKIMLAYDEVQSETE